MLLLYKCWRVCLELLAQLLTLMTRFCISSPQLDSSASLGTRNDLFEVSFCLLNFEWMQSWHGFVSLIGYSRIRSHLLVTAHRASNCRQLFVLAMTCLSVTFSWVLPRKAAEIRPIEGFSRLLGRAHLNSLLAFHGWVLMRCARFWDVDLNFWF